jgi:hypothetical protein
MAWGSLAPEDDEFARVRASLPPTHPLYRDWRKEEERGAVARGDVQFEASKNPPKPKSYTGSIIPLTLDNETGERTPSVPGIVPATVDSIKNAYTAPAKHLYGDVPFALGAGGNIDPLGNPETNFAAADIALNMPLGAVAAGAGLKAAGIKEATGDLGIFAGAKAMTADFEKLSLARRMESGGRDPNSIWEQTGWGRGADGQWRFEIDDSKAKLSNDARIMLMTGNKLKAGDPASLTADATFTHPELYDAYPQLKEMPLGSLAPGKGNLGRLGPDGISVDATRPLPDVQSTLLHEMQHGVQEIEGFGRGGNAGEFKHAAEMQINGINNRLSELAKQIDEVSRTGKIGPNGSVLKELRAEYDKLMDTKLTKLVPQAQDPYSSYRRLAGEVEARNTQHREKWDAQKRSDVPPVFSQDVPTDQQIVRFDRGRRSAEDVGPKSAPLSLAPAGRQRLVASMYDPATKRNIIGDPTDTHASLAAKNYDVLGHADDMGFTNPVTGERMDRSSAMSWLKQNDPDAYAAYGPYANSGRLEAQKYNNAFDISRPPLKGMSTTAEVPGFGSLAVGPNQRARAAAAGYMKKAGLKYDPPSEYVPVDPQRAARVADEFERMPHAPNDPEVAASYGALIDETKAQFEAMPKNLKIEFIKPGMEDPYKASPRLVQKDIAENNHMWVYPTESGFGKEGFEATGNPMLNKSGVTVDGRELANNDLFRIVHDYFGHAKEGVGFRATGEDNAFRQHRSMFSPAAQRALTTETRGQNSWLNYGPQGAKNRTAKTEDTTFADQKVGLMPEWTTLYANSKNAAPLSVAAGLTKQEQGWVKKGMTPEQAQIMTSASQKSPSKEFRSENVPFNFPGITAGDTRISTRVPSQFTEKGNKRDWVPDAHNEHLSVDTKTMSTMPSFEHNVGLLADYPGFSRLRGMPAQEAADQYINQTVGNTLHLMSRLPDEVAKRSPKWYEGAQRVSGAFAEKWGVARHKVSAAIAALSPQKDWFQNASLAQRIGDIMFGDAASKAATKEMITWARTAKKSNSEELLFDKPEDIARINQIEGKRFDELTDDKDRAMWVRAYDEAHNKRYYREITPEGEVGPWSMGDKGEAKISWGSQNEIEKAVRALRSGDDPSEISRILSDTHKVRSFYNNIENPWDARYGDATIDTHQVGGSQLRSVSQRDPAVLHNFALSPMAKNRPEGFRATASAGSPDTGIHGTYPLLNDTLRQAGDILGALPREVQSPTWEGIRLRFPRETKGKGFDPDMIWGKYDRGEITLDQARDLIVPEGSIPLPSYAQPGYKSMDPRLRSTYVNPQQLAPLSLFPSLEERR